MKKIKAVFFDLDDTLFPSSKFALLARMNALEAMKRAGMKASVAKAFKILLSLVEDRKKYGPNFERHYDIMLKMLHEENDPKIVSAGVGAYHASKNILKPFPEVAKILHELRDAGLLIYVITEGKAVKQWDKLHVLGLADLIHGAFIGEEGKEKLLRKALRELGLKAKDAMMVGDREDKDIAPAKKLGLFTVRVLRGKYSKEKSSRADFVLKDLEKLPEIIEKLSP